MEFLYRNPYEYPWDYSKPIEENFCEAGNFEAIMDRDGNMYQIPNGHSTGAIAMLLHDKSMSYNEFVEKADMVYYLEWLLYFSETIMLRKDSFQGYPNEKQKEKINWLVKNGFMDSCYDLIHSDYFNPKEYFEEKK